MLTEALLNAGQRVEPLRGMHCWAMAEGSDAARRATTGSAREALAKRDGERRRRVDPARGDANEGSMDCVTIASGDPDRVVIRETQCRKVVHRSGGGGVGHRVGATRVFTGPSVAGFSGGQRAQEVQLQGSTRYPKGKA